MARKFTLTLLSDDPALQVAVAAMVRQHPQSFDLFCLASRDALMALRDAGTDLVLIDADTAGDVVASVAAAALVQPAPVIVIGLALGREEAVDAACLAHGATAVLSNAAGPGAPGLAGAEGDALISRLTLLVQSANRAAS
jgi:DNA-binding NarL/FixJ family response regulator